MAVLAETYLHLTVQPTERQISETQAYLQYLAAVFAIERFGQDVFLDFRVEQGSLKGWLTVAGGLYVGICNYGSLREGIDYAVKDARAFSEFIIDHLKSEVPMPQGALYRTERRLGLPGRIQRLYPLLEETSDLVRSRNTVEAQKHLHQVQEQLDRIAADLAESGEDQLLQLLQESIPASIRNRLPGPTPPNPISEGAVPLIAINDKKRTVRERPKEILLRQPKPPKPPQFRE